MAIAKSSGKFVVMSSTNPLRDRIIPTKKGAVQSPSKQTKLGSIIAHAGC